MQVAVGKKRSGEDSDTREGGKKACLIFVGEEFSHHSAPDDGSAKQLTAELLRCESGASFSSSSSTTDERDLKRTTASDDPSPVHVEVVKKKKHNLVEQNRRETTRAMVAGLKDMVGADGGTAQHPNINKVLEGTLEFLRRNGKAATTQPSLAQNARGGIPDPNMGRYFSSFQAAPFGIICAKTDGCITRVNDQVERMFGLPAGFAKGKIIFRSPLSMTCPGLYLLRTSFCQVRQTLRRS